jgi:hypothetical protein
MGYNAYPDDILDRFGYTAPLLPNSLFDREKAREHKVCARDGAFNSLNRGKQPFIASAH